MCLPSFTLFDSQKFMPGQHLDLLLNAVVLHDLRLKVCQRRVFHLPIVSGGTLGRKEALRGQDAAGSILGDASQMQHIFKFLGPP